MPRINDLEKLEIAQDTALGQILQKMLEEDEDITFRSVAKKHPELKAVSSITRISDRRQLVEEFQKKQESYREWRGRVPKASKDRLAEQLAEKDVRIAELERQVEVLRASHVVMIRIVGELGGTTKLLSLYERYREFRGELDKMDLISHAEVVALNAPPHKKHSN